MSLLHRGHTLAGLLTRRTPLRQSATLPNSRFFTSSPRSLGSQFFASKRPKPAAMDTYTIVRLSYRTYGSYGFQRLVATKRMSNIIIGLNIAIWGTWVYADSFKDTRLQEILMNNFTLSWFNVRAQRAWTLITNAFSHQDFTHLLFNMISFDAFASVLCWAGGVGVGPAHIWVLTLGSALVGSAAWLYQKKPTIQNGRFGPYGEHGLAAVRDARGASGVVSGFAAAAALIAPTMKMRLFFIPVGIPMWILAGAYTAMDVFYLNNNDNVGRSAHLGGTVFGAVYYLAALRGYGGVSRLLSRRY